jgi:hypothetical protein
VVVALVSMLTKPMNKNYVENIWKCYE